MTEPVLSWVEVALEERFGLHIGATLRPRLRAALADVPREACVSDQAWLERLVELATVQESYMFRHPQQIDAVVRHVAPLPRARVWSAACARGEEPLSLAIALGPESSHVELLASDVSQAAIDSARRGVYRAWSLRCLDAHTRARAFIARDGRFVAARAWVDRIQYRRINLACVTTPWPGELDVVMMRNVLLYFSSEQTRAVLRRVREVLRPDGVLVVSPAEAVLVAGRGWHATGVAGCFVPRETRAEALVPPVSPVVAAPRASVPNRSLALSEPSLDPRAAQLALARRLVRLRADEEIPS